jgi:hypothetical protein
VDVTLRRQGWREESRQERKRTDTLSTRLAKADLFDRFGEDCPQCSVSVLFRRKTEERRTAHDMRDPTPSSNQQNLPKLPHVLPSPPIRSLDRNRDLFTRAWRGREALSERGCCAGLDADDEEHSLRRRGGRGRRRGRGHVRDGKGVRLPADLEEGWETCSFPLFVSTSVM